MARITGAIFMNSFLCDEDWTVGVVGLGYVGLPLLMAAVASGVRGIGFDIAEQRSPTSQQASLTSMTSHQIRSLRNWVRI